MAKKAKAEAVEVAPQEVAVKAAPKKNKQKPVYVDKLYTLKGNKKPLTYTLQSKHSSRKPLLWFDEEKGYQRELRYSTNQASHLPMSKRAW